VVVNRLSLYPLDPHYFRATDFLFIALSNKFSQISCRGRTAVDQNSSALPPEPRSQIVNAANPLPITLIPQVNQFLLYDWSNKGKKDAEVQDDVQIKQENTPIVISSDEDEEEDVDLENNEGVHVSVRIVHVVPR